MSCHLRSVSLVDELVCGLDLRSRDTCTFLTFGKSSSSSSSTPRPAVVVPPPPTATGVGVRGAGNDRERKSSTETGPPDPSALRPGGGGGGGGESTPRARCPTPDDDDDDVFPVGGVGSSSMTSCRSVSVPPRRARPSAALSSLIGAELSSSGATTAAMKISPPRMKRRKKKSAAESSSAESDSRKVGSPVVSAGSSDAVLPVVSTSHGNKASADVTEPRATEEASNDDDSASSEGRDGDRLTTERPASEQSAGRQASSTSQEAVGAKRKKNIRWKSEVAAQSSPDVASDDADSKESGYITLEDLQAQLGLSSWSSDERQTDLDAGSSSGDELRAPDGLRGGAGTQSTSSALAGSSAAVLLPPPPAPSSSFLSPLMRPEQFAAFDGGGAVDCCRSAPPTCDASLLRFTFTVRLDSKMFHRRTAAAAANRGRDPPPVTDGRERERRETVVGRDRELCKPAAVPDAATGGGSDDPSAPGAPVEKLASPAPAAVDEHSSSPKESAPSSDQQNAAVSASPPPPDCAGSASKTAQQQQQQQAFAGEKVVVTAEVHRSADQLDTDRPHHNNNNSNSNNNNNNNNNKTPRSLGAAAASCCPRPKTKSFGAKEAARRTASRPRAPSPPCQPDDVIVSCSPEAELVGRCSRSIQHDQVVDAGFNGRLSYVDVDRVMSFSRQRSSTSSAQRNSSIRKLSDGLTLTLRRPLKLRNSAAATADPRTLPRKKPSDSGTAGRWCLQRTVDGAAASTSEARSAAAAADRHASRERRAPARVFSESSSVSSADSDPEICGPCVARDASAACARGCPPRSGRRRAGKPLPGILGGSGGGGDDGGAGPASTKSAAAATRSQSTRRALRQFFRVDNLFACRHGGRPGGSADRPAEGTSRAAGEPQDAGRGGCEAATTQRGRRSETPAALARTCRRSSRVGGQSRTRRGADVAYAGAASRSVSPHARSRDARPTYPTAASTRPVGTCRGSGGDRHRSRDRCRHVAAPVEDAASAAASVANSSHVGSGHQRWNTLCLSPSDNSILTPESGCGFSGRRRVLATTPISPSTPAPDSLPHAVTLGECFSSLHRSRMRIL